ncbi:MAG: hypothetical protein ACI9WC_000126 [Arenicella sp.]|jgi:hypothetical protein
MSKNNTEKTHNEPSNVEHHCGLTEKFWDKFVASVWEKETFVERKNFVTPPISEQELFECVVDMGIKHCQVSDVGGENSDVRIYVGATEIKKNFAPIFPKLSDGDFAGYSKRVSKAVGGQSFSFVIDEIVMPESLKIWTHSFLKGMYRPLKSMSNGHMWSIFFGDYSTTPYGVHDHSSQIYSESAFYFPIAGKKEMATWRPSYVNENPKLKWAHDCSEHLHEATRLLAEPGGMMYWPSDRWHIGSSKGGDVSIVLAVRAFTDIYPMFLHSIVNLDALSAYKPSGIRAKLLQFSESLLFLKHMALLKYSARARQNQVRDLPFDPDDLQGSARDIPEDLIKLGARFNIGLYFGKNIEKVLSIFWLYHLTNLGVESLNSPMSPICVKPSLKITKCPSAVLLWRHVDSDTIILMAGRHAHEIPAAYLLMVQFVAATQIGQEVLYNELVDSVAQQNISPHQLEKQLERLLNFLGEAGVFTSL